MKALKLKKVKRLMNDCRKAKKYVLEDMPKNEMELIKSLSNNFTGYSKHQKKNGKFIVTAEISEYPENLDGVHKIGFITFTVPSCTVSFDRDKEGKILNHNQFK